MKQNMGTLASEASYHGPLLTVTTTWVHVGKGMCSAPNVELSFKQSVRLSGIQNVASQMGPLSVRAPR